MPRRGLSEERRPAMLNRYRSLVDTTIIRLVLGWGLWVPVLLVLSPITAAAQSASAGTVRDATGAVLPGVTVEAGSPALIERTRTTVTDDQGQYRIVDLRPGTQTVTFTLSGFSTVRREGLELLANFTAPVNAEMRVGTLEETITVTGESPLVDVQTTPREQRV